MTARKCKFAISYEADMNTGHGYDTIWIHKQDKFIKIGQGGTWYNCHVCVHLSIYVDDIHIESLEIKICFMEK